MKEIDKMSSAIETNMKNQNPSKALKINNYYGSDDKIDEPLNLQPVTLADLNSLGLGGGTTFNKPRISAKRLDPTMYQM